MMWSFQANHSSAMLKYLALITHQKQVHLFQKNPSTPSLEGLTIYLSAATKIQSVTYDTYQTKWHTLMGFFIKSCYDMSTTGSSVSLCLMHSQINHRPQRYLGQPHLLHSAHRPPLVAGTILHTKHTSWQQLVWLIWPSRIYISRKMSMNKNILQLLAWAFLKIFIFE